MCKALHLKLRYTSKKGLSRKAQCALLLLLLSASNVVPVMAGPGFAGLLLRTRMQGTVAVTAATAVAFAPNADDDNDGLTNLQEGKGFDPSGDTDLDGVPNYRDATPGTLQPAFVDSNGDGINDFYDADLDGKANHLDIDSDNDGIPDLIEAGGIDTNGDGHLDAPGVGIPPSNWDLDGDGVLNEFDLDADNDGIPDILESGGTDLNNDGRADVLTDGDGDGLVDAYDPDTNNDGVMDFPARALILTTNTRDAANQASGYTRSNFDNDRLPNAFDHDSDGDGIPDVIENGIQHVIGQATASGPVGTDGWNIAQNAQSTFVLRNSDNDIRPNYLDIDSDGDGITDNVEGLFTNYYKLPQHIDADKDGIDAEYDANENLLYVTQGIDPVNFQGASDQSPDYIDTDTDDDGLLDINEGHDGNGDGFNDFPVTGIDNDNDGLDNAFDLDNTGPNVTMQGMNAVTIIGFQNPPANPPVTLGARGPLPLAKLPASQLDRAWRTIDPASVLPITLVSFKAQVNDGGVSITWEADNQVGFANFVLERSTNGVSFSTVATIPAKEGLKATYDYQDNPAGQGAKVYYRLKQVDQNQAFTYSRVLTVVFEIIGLGANISPNPATDYVNINISITKKQPVTVRIIDNMGRLLIEQRTIIDKGDNIIRLDKANTLQNGQYTLTVTAGTERVTKKLLIRK